MGFRFSRRVRLLPGVRLNFSKSGVSASFGIPGASVTLGQRGAHLNLGIPGTGLAFRTRLDQPAGKGPVPPPRQVPRPSAQPAFHPTGRNPSTDVPSPSLPSDVPPEPFQGSDLDPLHYSGRREFRSAHPDTLSSPHLKKLAELVSEAEARRGQITTALSVCRSRIAESEHKLRRARNWLIRPFVSKARITKIETCLAELKTDDDYLANLMEGTVIDAFFGLSEEAKSEYLYLRDAFSALAKSHAIWDISSANDVNRFVTRSAASHAITRTPVQFDLARTAELDSEFDVPHLPNANGGDLYFYPGLLAVRKPTSGFAFLDMRDVDITLRASSFVEEEAVPSDAERIGHVWAKANKDGSPDRRFANNYQIPLLRYGEITLTSRTGLNEVYMVSNARALADFGQTLKRYSATLERSKPADEQGSDTVPFDQVPDLKVPEHAPSPSLFSFASFVRLALLTAVIAAVGYVIREHGGLPVS